jgi:ribonuclease P protein component
MEDEPPARLQFGRSMRLRTKRDFSQVRAEGHRLARGCLIGNWKVLPPGAPLRLGVITSKKLGSSVVRSRARRLMRENFRRHQHDFRTPVDLVLIARSSIVGKTFVDVERDFLSLLKQANLLKAESE